MKPRIRQSRAPQYQESAQASQGRDNIWALTQATQQFSDEDELERRSMQLRSAVKDIVPIVRQAKQSALKHGQKLADAQARPLQREIEKVRMENKLMLMDQVNMVKEVDRLSDLSRQLAKKLEVRTIEAETLRAKLEVYEKDVQEAVSVATTTIREHLSHEIRARCEEREKQRTAELLEDLEHMKGTCKRLAEENTKLQAKLIEANQAPLKRSLSRKISGQELATAAMDAAQLLSGQDILSNPASPTRTRSPAAGERTALHMGHATIGAQASCRRSNGGAPQSSSRPSSATKQHFVRVSKPGGDSALLRMSTPEDLPEAEAKEHRRQLLVEVERCYRKSYNSASEGGESPRKVYHGPTGTGSSQPAGKAAQRRPWSAIENRP